MITILFLVELSNTNLSRFLEQQFLFFVDVETDNNTIYDFIVFIIYGDFMKIYCASDMHIGYEYSNYPKIKEFFNVVREDADELILCGDTFDLWRYPYHKILNTVKPNFLDVMELLKRTAWEVPTTIIPGNHDYNLKKVWKDYSLYNVLISQPFKKGGTYFCHGWRFDLKQRLGSIFYWWLVYQFPYIYQRFFKKPSQIILPNDESNSHIITIHDEATNYAHNHNLNYVVMGHTHIPHIYDHIVDCGDFVDSCSYITIDNDIPKLHYIDP